VALNIELVIGVLSEQPCMLSSLLSDGGAIRPAVAVDELAKSSRIRHTNSVPLRRLRW
jgi:hypothetical protein